MNKNDLAALAALGAMGYMYMNRDKGGSGSTEAEGTGTGGMRSSDVVYGGGAGAGSPSAYSFGPGAAGSAGAGAGAGAGGMGSPSAYSIGPETVMRGGNEQRYKNSGGGGGGGGSRVATTTAPSPYSPVMGAGSPSAYGDLGGPGLPPPATEEDTGISGTNIGLGAAGVGAAATAAAYARYRAQMQAAEEARAKQVAETKRGILADRAQAQVDADRKAADQAAAEEKDRLQAQERAAMDEEIRRGLKKGQTKVGPGTPDRTAVLSKDAWMEGPSTDKKLTTLGKTVVSETPAQTKARNAGTGTGSGRGGQGGASSAEMDDFSKLLRESKVGPKGTTTKEAGKIKASGAAGKVGLALTALGLGSAANAAVNMTAGERERLAGNVAEGLITPLGLTPTMAGEGSDFGYSDKPLSRAERQKIIDTMTPAEKKKMQEALARQGQKPFNFDFSSAAGMKRGGQTKAKKMASGGMTSKASSASKRGDGIAAKGKTNCKMY